MSSLLKLFFANTETSNVVPLTFRAEQDASTVSLLKNGSPSVDGLQYRIGEAGEWVVYSIGSTISLSKVGDVVQFQNINDNLSLDASNYVNVKCTGKVSASGSLRSLVNYSDAIPNFAFLKLFLNCSQMTTAPLMDFVKVGERSCENMFDGCNKLTVAPELPATEIAYKSYVSMFWNCSSLITPPSILPAETIYEECYANMFYSCSKLATAPILPATVLPNRVYAYMFYYCNALKEAPALPATTLAANCYESMFHGCTALIKAPALPATNLEQNCYYEMFRGCSSLTEAPYLPATVLKNTCYKHMFYDCKKLAKIKVAFTSWSASTTKWVYNVSTTGNFECPLSLPVQFGIDNIPQNWVTNGVGSIIISDQKINKAVNEDVNFRPTYSIYPSGGNVEFAIYQGSLPEGLVFHSDGSITGKASEQWQGDLFIEVTGDNYRRATFKLTIKIRSAEEIETPNNLTSDTSNPDFVVSQSVTNTPAWRAMDGNDGTSAKTAYSSGNYNWWQIDFLKPVSITGVDVHFTNGIATLQTYLEYSDDGITFERFDNNAFAYNANESRSYERGTPHRYYRFKATSTYYWIQIYEVKFIYIPVDKFISFDDEVRMNGITGEAFNKQLSYKVYPSDLPVNFSITEGTLPDGLMLDSSTGTITGTPTEIGEFYVTITMSAEGVESISSLVLVKILEKTSVPSDALVYLDGTSISVAETGQGFVKGSSSSDIIPTTVNGYPVLHFSGEYGCLISSSDITGLATGNADRCVSLYVKPDKTSTMGLVSYGQNSANNAWQFCIIGDRLKIGGSNNASNEYTSNNSGIPTDQWRHCLINKIGSTEYLYMNGELIGQFTYSRNTSAGKVVIGAGQDQNLTTGSRFKGYMTGIRIFNRSLSDEEILSLANEYTF